MRLAIVAAIAATLALAAPAAQAGPLISRTDLQSALGGPGTLEDFETYPVANGDAATLACVPITSASTCNGQGPGLVRPGLALSNAGLLQWNGVGFGGAPSREVFGQENGLTVDFSIPITAFGLDARTFSAFGLALGLLRVYAEDDTTEIGSLAGIVLDETGSRIFVGWQDAAGIGKIVLSGSAGISPIIDNLEYGAVAASVPTPEPTGITLLALGLTVLAARRRRAA